MAHRLQTAATDLLRTAGFVEQPDGSWKPGVPGSISTEIALPHEVAPVLGTTVNGLSQMRYRGTGPKFIKVGPRKVVYRWSDVREFLDANTIQRSDEHQTASAS